MNRQSVVGGAMSEQPSDFRYISSRMEVHGATVHNNRSDGQPAFRTAHGVPLVARAIPASTTLVWRRRAQCCRMCYSIDVDAWLARRLVRLRFPGCRRGHLVHESIYIRSGLSSLPYTALRRRLCVRFCGVVRVLRPPRCAPRAGIIVRLILIHPSIERARRTRATGAGHFAHLVARP